MIWWYILIGIVALVLSFFLSLKAGEIASDKGYDGDQWTWLCFLLGLGAYILVAAMPDLEERKVLKDISVKLEQITANSGNPVSEAPQTTRRSVPVVPAANYSAGWICKKCGTSNQDGKLFCKGCGEYR